MGIIHDVAVLDPDEVPQAKAIGLPVLPTERALFSLPCPHLEGTRCGIYADRPKACARYKCQLLQDLEAGLAPMEDALVKVTEAKRLLDLARAVLPKSISYQQARRIARGLDPEKSGSLSKEAASLLKLRVTALDLFIDKFFRNSRDRKSFELSAIELESEKN